MRVPTKYEESFKSDAVNLVQRGDRTLAEVARDLGVNHWTLRDWCRTARMAKRRKNEKGKALRRTTAQRPDEQLRRLGKENERLRKENDSLRMDREILKKAAAFFVKESE